MSRCFPFPPPGYEKKTIIDVGDLITKEKRKEKKHKKEKKDKERKEGKEKKDKEKSKEKHREKKERKEKHKDKDKKDNNRSKDKKDKDRNKEKGEGSDEKRIEVPHDYHNGGRLAKSSQHGDEIKDSEFVHELARRIGEGNGATGSHMVQKTSVSNHEREKIPRREVESYINHLSAENDKHGKKVVGRRVNGQEVHSNVYGNSVDNHSSLGDHWKLEVSATPVAKKNVENGIVGKWKNGIKEDDDLSIKPMGRDQDKSDREKNKERGKLKEKKEKVKQSYESSIVQSGQKDSSGNRLWTCTEKPVDMSKDGDDNKSSAGDSILGKRKEMGKNGHIHDRSTRPCKSARHVSSIHLSSENGKKFEPSQNSLQLLAEKPLPYSNGKVTIKEKRTNGSIEPQQPNSGPVPTNVQVDENNKASEKPPHPDIKHLNQILAVPRVEELPEIDYGDQEWLFNDNNTQAEQSRTYMTGDELKQVWAEAVRFDDADLIALPYVIPY